MESGELAAKGEPWATCKPEWDVRSLGCGATPDPPPGLAQRAAGPPDCSPDAPGLWGSLMLVPPILPGP